MSYGHFCREWGKVKHLFTSGNASEYSRPKRAREEPVQELEYFDSAAYREGEIKPDLVDTREWTWYDWVLTFLGMKLTENQIQELEAMDSHMYTLRIIYRRSGKTTVVNFAYILRHLCESIWHPQDRLIYYYSGVEKNLIQIGFGLIEALYENEQILRNYGFLVKEYVTAQKGKKRKAKNTITEITLKTLKRPFQANYIAINLGEKFRGAQNAYKIIIDDPVDTKEVSEDHYTLITDKLELNLIERLFPLAKDAKHISISGTPYAFDDIFERFKDKAGWKLISRPVATKHNFETGWSLPEDIDKEKLKPSDIIVHDEEEWELTDPVIWENKPRDPKASAIQNVIWAYITMQSGKFGVRGFYKEYLMIILALNAVINYEKFKRFTQLPQAYSHYNWAWFMDDATGEKEKSDDRALALVAFDPSNFEYYIMDMLFFKKIGKEKIDTILRFHVENTQIYQVPFAQLVEVVKAQRETYQRLRDEEGLMVQAINPRGRGDKEYRIKNNLIVLLDEERLNMKADIRHESKFRMECHRFPQIHVNMLDAVDQCLYHLSQKTVSTKFFRVVK